MNLLDGSSHEYDIEPNNQIRYKVFLNTSEEKNILLCEKFETCEFIYDNNKLTTKIKINGLTYINIFKI